MASFGNVMQNCKWVLNFKLKAANCQRLVDQAVRCSGLAAVIPGPCNCRPACSGRKAFSFSNRTHSTQSTLRDVRQHVTEPLQPSTFCRRIRHDFGAVWCLGVEYNRPTACQKSYEDTNSVHSNSELELAVLLIRCSGSDGT